MRFFRLSFWAVVTMFASVFLFSGSSVSAVNVPNKLYSIATYQVNSVNYDNQGMGASTYPTGITNTYTNFTSARVNSFSVSGSVPVSKTGISYTGKAVITYDIYGLSTSLELKDACQTGQFSKYGMSADLIAEQGIIIGKNTSFSCNVNSDNTRVVWTINTTANLQSSVVITSFSYLINGGSNGLSYCSNSPGATIPYCGSAFNVTINNVQLDFTISEDPNTALLGEIGSKLDTTNQKLDNINDSITNSNSAGAQDDAGNFFSGFQTNTHGLTGIITAPLNLIQSITSQSCSSLGIPLPFVNETLNLPCMSEIYQQNFGPFLLLYQTITTGFIGYWVIVRIFALVKDFKNPDHDEVEVLDL